MPQNRLADDLSTINALIEGMEWMFRQPHFRMQPAHYRKMGQLKLEKAYQQKAFIEKLINERQNTLQRHLQGLG